MGACCGKEDQVKGPGAAPEATMGLEVESIRLEKAVEKAKMFPSKVASFRMRKKREGRRQAIKAELEDTDSTVEFIPKLISKTSADKERIMLALGQNFMFKTLEPALCDAIVNAMEAYNVSAGTEVIKQGEKGDYFYVVNTGRYDVYLTGTVEPVTSYVHPALFGELACLYSSPRAATVKAVSGGSLWRVDRATFRGLLLNSAAARLMRFLRSVPVLTTYSEHALTHLAQGLEYRAFVEGEEITRAPRRFYIVRDGKVDVRKLTEPQGPTLKTITSGDFFGDREMLSGFVDRVYTAGPGGCKLLALNKANFNHQLSSLHESLMDQVKLSTMQAIDELQDVTDDQLAELLDSFKMEKFEQGQTVIAQGEPGCKLHILLKGRAERRTDGQTVGVLQPYSHFGGRWLLDESPSSADVVVTAEGGCQMLTLERLTFDSVLGALADIIERQKKIRMLKSVPLLAPLSETELLALADVCSEARFEHGEAIITQGEPGNHFYIVEKGNVFVTKSEQPDQELLELGVGAFFGERALLSEKLGEPRAANVWARGAVLCFSVARADFNTHLGSLQDRIKLHAAKMEKQSKEKEVQLQELEEIAPMGSGAFGLVTLVRHRPTGHTYALKAVNKQYLQKTRTGELLKREVMVLMQLDSPFVMHLVKTFRDARKYYMLTEPLLGGELFTHLSDCVTFTEARTRFYISSVLLALQHMHGQGVVYRDLKLENLMLDRNGHLKVIDFGFAKKLHKNEWTYTLCGTPDYLAPEVLKGTGHSFGVDYWSLGVLIYEMIFGCPPFTANNDAAICKNILSANLSFDGNISKDAKDLIRRLLDRDSRTRLGCGKAGIKEIFKHPWFSKVNWADLEKGKAPVPFVPEVRDETDVSNFDEVAPEDMHTEHCEPCHDKSLDALFGDSF